MNNQETKICLSKNFWSAFFMASIFHTIIWYLYKLGIMEANFTIWIFGEILIIFMVLFMEVKWPWTREVE